MPSGTVGGMTLPYDATAHVLRDGQQLLDAAGRTGLDAAVASCPGWQMRDLVWHVTGVWSFWSAIAGDGLVDLDQVRNLEFPGQPGDDVLVDVAAAALTRIYGVLDSTPPDAEFWTWTGGLRDREWLRRRMTQETAVHRWDAERTVGDVYEIPIAVAADGIDEFLRWFAARGRTAPIGGTAHIHCTDTDRDVATGTDDISAVGGEWTISRLDADGIEYDRSHSKSDVAIRGRARDVLLYLWGRDAGPVEILGDASIAERLVGGAQT